MPDSDDDVDPELLELLRQSLVNNAAPAPQPPTTTALPVVDPQDTKVLSSVEYITDQSVDVALDPRGTKAAAQLIYSQMQKRGYSTKTWSTHELHPQINDHDDDDKKQDVVDFIFTMDLLNFCFWSDKKSEEERFAVEYQGKRWTGYWSLVAALRRAIDEGIPITTPSFWNDHDACTDETIRHVFRSCTDEEMPLLDERIRCLREAGHVLCTEFNAHFHHLLLSANKSAAKLINLLVAYMPSIFRDVFRSPFDDDDNDGYEDYGGQGRTERKDRRELYFLKRAQILVADLWACFGGKSYGEFEDVEKVTMFADYRIPQMLHTLGCISYSPPLEAHIRALKEIPSGHSWEIQIRGCSIWTIELLRRQIQRLITTDQTQPQLPNPDSQSQPLPQTNLDPLSRAHSQPHPQPQALTQPQVSEGTAPPKSKPPKINAILIDFFLYDTVKELLELEKAKDGMDEQEGGHEVGEQRIGMGMEKAQGMIPHHRVRSIWY